MQELDPARHPLEGRTIGRYEVLHLLSVGGMGSVYVGRSAGVGAFERLVALKMLHEHLAHDPELVRMFLDEARLAARIRHSNVVATLDVCRTPEGHFLVMEYIDGADLAKLVAASVERESLLPVPVVMRIALDALAGLGVAHGLTDAQGRPLELVHRDLSPHNILVGVDGVARLADFGVANARSRASSTDAARFAGKIAYASPEHLGSGVFDQRSDLFGVGIVLWEALTGTSLFRAASRELTMRRVLDGPIPLLSSVRSDLGPLDSVLARALARSAGDRFQSAAEMAEAVEGAARHFGGLATSRTVGEIVSTLARERLDADRAAIDRAIRARPAAPARGIAVTELEPRYAADATPPSWGPLPSPPSAFVGRADHLARVARLFPSARAIVVTGPAGGGKSAFARAAVAANAAGRETRGLQCTSDGGVLEALERMLGVEGASTTVADRAGTVARHLDERALVVAVEDVHVLPHAERARLLLVLSALRQATLILTAREPIELADAVPSAVYVDLPPLTDQDARELVADLLDRRGARGDVGAIVDAAAGNPLWCTLLSGAGRLSDRLASLIEDLDPEAMVALESLALFRRPVPHAWAGDRSEMAVLASRYLCADAGPGRVEMHDVVRSTVAGALPEARAAEIHVGHAARWAAVGEHEERLHHLVASRDLVALRDALAGGLDEWLVSKPWLNRSLEYIGQIHAAGIEVGSRLWLREASELAYSGRLAEARVALERAGPAAPGDVLVDCVARISIIYAERGSASERDELLERASKARQRIGRKSSADWVRLMVAALWDHSARGDRRRAIDLCREVLADETLGPGDRSKVLRTAADLAVDAPAGHRDLDEAETLLAAQGSPYLTALGDIVRARLYLEQGEVGRARVVYQRALPVILEHDQTVTVGIYGRALEPRFAAATGEVEEPIAHMRRWLDEHREGQQIAQRSWANAVMALAAREADHPELARRCARVVLLAPARERHRYDTAEALLTLACARAAGEQPERAIRPAVAALESARRAGMPFVAAPAASMIAEVLASSGRHEEAERLAELLLRAAAVMEMPRLRVRALIVLAGLALRSGAAERALELAETAASVARDTAEMWEHARAAAVAGWASLTRGREEDARVWLARAESERFEPARTAVAGLSSLALFLDGREAEPYPWWVAPTLTAVHLELDADNLRALVDGARVVDFASQPLLAKLLGAVLSEPDAKWDKGALFERVWELPYRSQARDAAIYKAVARLCKALDPSDPHRFVAWQDGVLVLKNRSVRLR